MIELCFVASKGDLFAQKIITLCDLDPNTSSVVVHENLPRFLPQVIRNFWIKYQIKKLKNQRVIVSFCKTIAADIYFFDGKKLHDSLQQLQKSRIVIVGSAAIAQACIKKGISAQKIHIMYEPIIPNSYDAKQVRQKYFEQFGLEDKGQKIIGFIATDLKKNGIIPFLEIVKQLEEGNYCIFMGVPIRQAGYLQILLGRYVMREKVHLHIFKTPYELQNAKELLAVCDIFLYPTTTHAFATIVLEAMYYHNAVFLPATNHASEILDHFAIMNNPSDMATVHKIEALLGRSDLQTIQDRNHTIAKNFTQSSSIELFLKLASDLALND